VAHSNKFALLMNNERKCTQKRRLITITYKWIKIRVKKRSFGRELCPEFIIAPQINYHFIPDDSGMIYGSANRVKLNNDNTARSSTSIKN
jgi:hypothetical protein